MTVTLLRGPWPGAQVEVEAPEALIRVPGGPERPLPPPWKVARYRRDAVDPSTYHFAGYDMEESPQQPPKAGA